MSASMNYKTWLTSIQEARAKGVGEGLLMEVTRCEPREVSARLEVEAVPFDPRAPTQGLLDEPSDYWAHNREGSWSADVLNAERASPRAPISLWLSVTEPKGGHALHPGDELLLSPPDFLAALHKKINDRLSEEPEAAAVSLEGVTERLRARARRAQERLTLGEDPGGRGRYAAPPSFRPAQAAAIAASALPLSFVWGPPGTGKTFTLGHIIAQSATLARPQRALVLTVANRAVERVLLSADDAYRALTGEVAPEGLLLRTQVPTLDEVRARPHLTAWSRLQAEHSETLEGYRQARRRLLSERGGGAQLLERLSDLKRQEDAARKEYREARAQLVQGARAVFCTLNQFAWSQDVHGSSFDLVVIEEASMVPMLYAMELFESFPAARFVVAGDPYQLSPVSELNHPAHPRWFCSIFGHFKLNDLSRAPVAAEQGPTSPPSELNFLDLQSRMPPALGDALSESFYQARLRSAPSAAGPLEIPGWPASPLVWLDQRAAVEVAAESGISLRGGGGKNSCHHQARAAILLASDARDFTESVQVITPFVNQERLLKGYADSEWLTDVPCSTIHKAQGSEADVVIFSLVDPGGWFLSASPSARELCVVASSRARRALVLVGDRQAALRNIHLRRLAERAVVW